MASRQLKANEFGIRNYLQLLEFRTKHFRVRNALKELRLTNLTTSKEIIEIDPNEIVATVMYTNQNKINYSRKANLKLYLGNEDLPFVNVATTPRYQLQTPNGRLVLDAYIPDYVEEENYITETVRCLVEVKEGIYRYMDHL